jgi:hypothetical protein
VCSKLFDGLYPPSASTAERRSICSVIRENPVYTDSNSVVKENPDRFEIYCTNLDQSTNAFDRYYVARGDQIVDVWPIMGRTGAAQR